VLPIQPPRTVRMPVHAADGLVKTFNALLEIAQTEAHSRRSAWEPFRLVALAGDVAELYAPLAEDKHLALELDLGHEAVIHGSRHLIAQALGNLLDNAITFTPTGGRIRLAVEQHGGHIALVVEDTGPGVPAGDHDRVTRRFVRLDGARHTPGNGLGLSLVKAVADLHGASLHLSDHNSGLRVEMVFPASPRLSG
jgi:signal transduction histidine kinase